MKDVYYKVDRYLEKNNFYNATVEEQKEMVEEGLKEYALEKIGQLDLVKGLNLSKKKDEVSLDELVTILGELIPKDKHFDTLRHLTHYILNAAGVMQGFSIVWMEEPNPELIEKPEVHFNEGIWDKLVCHRETSYVQTFHFAHQTFKDEFKKTRANKQLIKEEN